METKKISKWDAAPDSIKEMHTIITGVCDALIDYDDDNKCEKMMVDALSKVLDDYNELEARHQKECGMISQYEEENRNLKDDIRTIIQEIADLVEEKIELEERLVRQSECSKDEIIRLKDRCEELAYRNAKYAWAIKTVLKKASYSPGHVAEELRIMAKKSTTPKDVIERWEGIADELLVDKINRLEKENGAILETIERSVGISEEMIDFISDDPYDSRVDRIITSIKRLEAQYDELKSEVAELEKEKIELEDRLVQQKREDTHEILIKHDAISELKAKIRELKEEIDKLKVDNNNLTTDNKRLSNAVEAWFDMFNDMRHKRDFLKKENKKLKARYDGPYLQNKYYDNI